MAPLSIDLRRLLGRRLILVLIIVGTAFLLSRQEEAQKLNRAPEAVSDLSIDPDSGVLPDDVRPPALPGSSAKESESSTSVTNTPSATTGKSENDREGDTPAGRVRTREIGPAAAGENRNDQSARDGTIVPSTKSKTVEAGRVSTVIANMSIRDTNGKVVYKGDINLAPTLERIERGERFPHRNDGGTFRNLERRLPQKPTGYYREYVVPTDDLDGPGPQRLVIGKEGETYYTPDHYQTFRKIR